MNFLYRRLHLLSSLAILACFANIANSLPAFAKVWTIDERQLQLMQDINQGQRLKHLSDKEAKKLREQLSNVARKKKKFQKGDSLSHAFSDAQKLELGADLDKVRADFKKFESANAAPAVATKEAVKEPQKELKKEVKNEVKKDTKKSLK